MIYLDDGTTLSLELQSGVLDIAVGDEYVFVLTQIPNNAYYYYPESNVAIINRNPFIILSQILISYYKYNFIQCFHDEYFIVGSIECKLLKWIFSNIISSK